MTANPLTLRVPSERERVVIRYFNGGRDWLSVLGLDRTIGGCHRAGWIEASEVSPYWRTTEDGRDALTRAGEPTPSR